MDELIRKVLAQQQWEITKGHINASVALRGAKRMTDPADDLNMDNVRHNEWLAFEKAAAEFIDLVEGLGWHD